MAYMSLAVVRVVVARVVLTSSADRYSGLPTVQWSVWLLWVNCAESVSMMMISLLGVMSMLDSLRSPMIVPVWCRAWTVCARLRLACVASLRVKFGRWVFRSAAMLYSTQCLLCERSIFCMVYPAYCPLWVRVPCAQVMFGCGCGVLSIASVFWCWVSVGLW